MNEATATLSFMKLNKKAINTVFQISALLILIAAVLYQFDAQIASWAMLAGAIGYGVTTVMNRYRGNSLRGKRLFNIQLFSVILIAVSTYLMFARITGWVITLLIAAILTLYYVFAYSRIDKQKKEEE